MNIPTIQVQFEDDDVPITPPSTPLARRRVGFDAPVVDVRDPFLGNLSQYNKDPDVKPPANDDDNSWRDAATRYLPVAKRMQARRCSYDRRLSEEIRLLDVEFLRGIAAPSISNKDRKHDRYSLRNMTPLSKFRSAAKSIAMIINVCNHCKSVLRDFIVNEKWYAMIDSLSINLRKPRPFMTYEIDSTSMRYKPLIFDRSEYSRDYCGEYLINDDIRRVLKLNVDERSDIDIKMLVEYLKRLSNDFRKHSSIVQWEIAKELVYNKFFSNRVVIRRDLVADGIYFVLTGTLLDKKDCQHSLSILKSGDCIGEQDVECGRSRSSTVITETSVELASLHRLDYNRIMNLASHDESPLGVCRKNHILRHFPIEQLKMNPGVWSLLYYKYGRLICQDSNKSDYIYLLIKGQARVIKCMDINQFEDKKEEKEDNILIKIDSKINSMSGASKKIRCHSAQPSRPSVRPNRPKTASYLQSTMSNFISTGHRTRGYAPQSANPRNEENARHTCHGPRHIPRAPTTDKKPRPRQDPAARSSYQRKHKPVEEEVCMDKTNVPAFVHLKCLCVGDIFGLRSCLQDSGPSASLVSSECKVLQINKRFFILNADNKIFNMIQERFKLYPDEREIMRILKTEINWAKYRKTILSRTMKYIEDKKVAVRV